MKNFLTTFSALRLGVSFSAIAIIFFTTCVVNFTNADPGTPIEISALELHKAFMADPVNAEKRYAGKILLIRGEIAIAKAAFTGWTMKGPLTVPSQVYFKTELDSLPTDIKYVVCEGSFDFLKPDGSRTLNPKIKVGSTLTVRCNASKLRWSNPGLYLSDCDPVFP
jgi:hypothetical protein